MDVRELQLRDARFLGVATRICVWLAQLDGGQPISNGDLRWLVGKARLDQYLAEIEAAKAERKARDKKLATDDITDGEVPGYISALHNALAVAKRAPPMFDHAKPPGDKNRARAFDKWTARRKELAVLTERLEEAWHIVDLKHHSRFRAPRPNSDPNGPGWDHSEGEVVTSLEWPPHLPKKLLDYLPEPHIVDVPRHQQRELLRDELDKLLVSPEKPPEKPLRTRVESMRKRLAA